MTTEHRHVPADYEVDGREPPSALVEARAEIARLRAAAIALRDDLLMRAEISRDGTKIVDASNGVWVRFNEALRSNADDN